MKRIHFALLALCFFSGTFLRAQQKASWKEMDDFHSVIAQTFHPAEEGNFDPIKTRSAELLQKATDWKNSTAPAGYDQAGVKKSLAKLVKGAKKVNDLVQSKATEQAIKEELSGVHDTFHEIMEKCGAEDHH